MDEDGPDLAELTCDPFEIAGVRFDDIIDAKALGPEAVLAQRLGERACRVNSADVENVRAGPHHVADRAAQIVAVAARSEARRVGKECVSPGRSWGAP